MTLGQKLKIQMIKAGIRNKSLSKATGMTAARLSNYLADRREPSIRDLEKLARALETDLNYFAQEPFEAV